jgi:hypothetical protein
MSRNRPRIMRCTHHDAIYTQTPVKLNRKVGFVVLLAGPALLGAGCSGINSSHSISPGTFLIPGMSEAGTPVADPAAPLPLLAPAAQFASAR